MSFLEDGREVLGFFHGYSNLQNYDREAAPLLADDHYRVFQEKDLRGLRNERGIIVGTARAHPGAGVKSRADLDDPQKTKRIDSVYRALVDLEVDALISIGGDGTLMTANLLCEYQKRLPAEAPRVRVIHLPKTIDNDYRGIDFTFGFFTAADVMAKELMNLRADAMATSSYYIVETMGRQAGWLSYAAAIAGEAHLVLSVEDIGEDLCEAEDGTPRLSLDKLAGRIVDVIVAREQRKKFYGTIVVAAGLGSLLARRDLTDVPRDDHGNLVLARVALCKRVAAAVAARYAEERGVKKKLTGVQMGYEARSAAPQAFDVMLGCQLGIGAYRGLVEEGLDGHMVSVSGQFDLRYVPFSELINPETLVTEVRFVPPGSDFQKLARFLETRVEVNEFELGRRREDT
jgi:6-phosphofructokinase 1